LPNDKTYDFVFDGGAIGEQNVTIFGKDTSFSLATSDSSAEVSGKSGVDGFLDILTDDDFSLEIILSEENVDTPFIITGNADGNIKAELIAGNLVLSGEANVEISFDDIIEQVIISKDNPAIVENTTTGFTVTQPNTPNLYAITFNANGGSVTPATVQTDADGKLSALPTPSRNGSYSFDGWYATASGGTKITISTVFTANATIYAHWTYTGGGSYGRGSASQVTQSDSILIDNTSAKDGMSVTADFTVEADTTALEAATPEETAPESWVNPFADIKDSDWFYDAVAYVYQRDLMTGANTNPMTFSPGMTLTRGMAATVLYRISDSPDVSGFENPFSDVADGKWYTGAAIWAYRNGIVSSYGNGKYGPEDYITRQDLAVILSNYAAKAGMPLPFAREYTRFNDDADIANYAKEAIERLFRANIVNGKPGNLYDPKDGATRAEFATMLMRFLETTEE
jgi:uncharacterized repeat protein (TIGR02543 family)